MMVKESSTVVEAQPMALTDEQLEKYRTEGFLVVPELLSPAEVNDFLSNADNSIFGITRHKTDPHYRHLATHPKIVGIVAQLLGGEPMIVQSMFLDKPAGGAKGITLHQDTQHLETEP